MRLLDLQKITHMALFAIRILENTHTHTKKQETELKKKNTKKKKKEYCQQPKCHYTG